MTTLDEIEARFERADKAQDAYLEGRSIYAAMVRSVACTGDVPKLVAALRAVEAAMDQLDKDRADGTVRTYGQIQRAVRDAVKGALDG